MVHFDSPDRVNKRAEEYSQVELIGGGTGGQSLREKGRAKNDKIVQHARACCHNGASGAPPLWHIAALSV